MTLHSDINPLWDLRYSLRERYKATPCDMFYHTRHEARYAKTRDEYHIANADVSPKTGRRILKFLRPFLVVGQFSIHKTKTVVVSVMFLAESLNIQCSASIAFD